MATDRDRDRDGGHEQGWGKGRGQGQGYRNGQTLPRGIRPRETTFESEYLCEFETKFENNLGYDSGFHME
jgi:hypothetical protein